MASTSRLDALPRVTCPNHPDAILVEDYRAGDMICPECGLVVGDRVIDVGSEWRTFSNDKATKDPSRVGDSQNPLLSDGDLSTMIGKVIDPLGRKHKVWTDQRPRSLATWQKYPSLPHEDF